MPSAGKFHPEEGHVSIVCTVCVVQPSRTKDLLKQATVSLARNEFRDVLLLVEGKRSSKKFNLKHEDLVIHRKFAPQGKCTITIKSSRVQLFVSNAPPHNLVIFLKSLAAKLAGNKLATPISARSRLSSLKANTIDGISPVTMKVRCLLEYIVRFGGPICSQVIRYLYILPV